MSNNYRMNLVWTSHGEQLRADLQRNLGVLTNTRGEVSRNSRQMGLWGQQIKAVGTTLRYAFAGAVVYGVATAVNALSDFEVKLGDIDSLAARVTDGRLVGLGDQLNEIGDFALQTSNRLGLAVGSVEDYMARFYSSFDPPAGRRGIEQVKEFTAAVSTLALAMGSEISDPQKLSSGIAGFMQAIPGSHQHVGATATRLTDIIAEVTRLSPVITGEDITRDIGRLGGAQTFSRMTPEQIFAVYGAASRAGGSGSVIGRGVTQLLGASIMRPTGKKQLAAFGALGLPTDPNALREMGGWEILMKMMKGVSTGPVKFRNAGALRQEDLTPEEAIQMSAGTGINMRVAADLFGRQESTRQFLNLMSLGGPAALEKFIASIRDAEKNHRAAQRAELARQQRTIQIAGNAQKNLNLQILRGFDPVIHVLSRGMTAASSFGIKHPDAMTGAIAGGATAAIASRVFLGASLTGLMGRGLSRIPGVGRLLARNPIFGRMAGRGGELAAAGLVGSGLGAFSSTGKGTRSDPIWVVIDPLSWFMPGSPSKGMLSGGGGGGTTIIPTGGAGRMGRAGRAGRIFGRGVPLLGTAIAAYEMIDLFREHDPAKRAQDAHKMVSDHQKAQKRVEDSVTKYWNDRTRRTTRVNDDNTGAISGLLSGIATLDIVLHPTDELKKMVKSTPRQKVPVKLWPQASGGGRPKTRGRAKTSRGQAGR